MNHRTHFASLYRPDLSRLFSKAHIRLSSANFRQIRVLSRLLSEQLRWSPSTYLAQCFLRPVTYLFQSLILLQTLSHLGFSTLGKVVMSGGSQGVGPPLTIFVDSPPPAFRLLRPIYPSFINLCFIFAYSYLAVIFFVVNIMSLGFFVTFLWRHEAGCFAPLVWLVVFVLLWRPLPIEDSISNMDGFYPACSWLFSLAPIISLEGNFEKIEVITLARRRVFLCHVLFIYMVVFVVCYSLQVREPRMIPMSISSTSRDVNCFAHKVFQFSWFLHHLFVPRFSSAHPLSIRWSHLTFICNDFVILFNVLFDVLLGLRLGF